MNSVVFIHSLFLPAYVVLMLLIVLAIREHYITLAIYLSFAFFISVCCALREIIIEYIQIRNEAKVELDRIVQNFANRHKTY